MPQVDLETLVSSCAGVSCDRKIACETIASTENHHQQESTTTDPPEIPPDLPPESFWLSKDAEFDWFDRNAFIDRKDSTKGNSQSSSTNHHQSNSQRFSNIKSKASIIGLPKPQKPCFVDTRRHGRPGKQRLFTKPKRSGSSNKPDASMFEPSSPKVSCMGRVRSKKDRNRKLRNRQRSVGSNQTCGIKEKSERKHKAGFFASFRAIFRGSSCKYKISKDASLSRKSSMAVSHDIRDRLPAVERDAPRQSVESEGFEPAGNSGGEPVGLGGMKRFASGRKSDSWIDVA